MKRRRKIKVSTYAGNKKRNLDYKNILYKYKLLQYLMDNIPDVIYFKDREGRLLLVNKAHANGFGLEPKDIIGKTDFDLFPKKHAGMMTRDDTRVMKTGKPIIDKIERATRPNVADNYVSTTKIPKYDKKGGIVGLIGITRDVTRRVRLERVKEKSARIKKRLEISEELNKIKSEFISDVSHELRTPLAIIKQLVTLIFSGIAGPISNKQKEILRRTEDNIDRLDNIIHELLDVSRIESGRFKLRYSLLNLKDLIMNYADFFKKMAQDKSIELKYNLPKKAVNLFVDADRVNQTISNLIDNAVKYTEQGGEIKVELKVFEAKIRVGVIDTGIGISESNLPLVFHKFTQVSKIEGAERKGIGLGLSLAKEWVERHGGEIWLESKLGVGSKFYFTLPRIYTLDILDTHIKDKINALLKKGNSFSIIELLIVNYKEFRERISVKGKKLFKDLTLIIEKAFKVVCNSGEEKPQIALADSAGGKCSIIFPRATEKTADQLSNLVKDKVKRYFAKSKMKDVFITLGIMSYPRKGRSYAAKGLLADMYIKKIHIGSEKRGFKRVRYKASIKFTPHEKKTDIAESVDISKGGICFTTAKLLKTDSRIELNLSLPGTKKEITVKGRIAWIKNMFSMPKGTANKYKVGLEFAKPNINIKKFFAKC